MAMAGEVQPFVAPSSPHIKRCPVLCVSMERHVSLSCPCPCRSILTVPWVELGGECNISCSKSGYSANIVFHTKPFYGGKKHRITADILWVDIRVHISWGMCLKPLLIWWSGDPGMKVMTTISGFMLTLTLYAMLYTSLPCSGPNDKKAFCSIEGEWNGVMDAKWASGVSQMRDFK